VAIPTELALVPVNAQTNARFKALSDELLYAWDRSDASVLREWGASTAATFGTSLKRRAVNLFKLAGLLGTGAAVETAAAINAFREGRLAHHLGGRVGAAYVASAELVTRVKVATSQAAQLVRSQPREAVPQLLVLVATSIVVSGGPDGDGGAPDLDLMFGIDAHRSVLSHSILMGAALETGFLSLVHLVRLLHAQLPADHDPLWDSLAQHADTFSQAANAGASLGMSYHLLVDGLAQPAPYHDLPVSMPMEAHQAVFVANGVAEVIDVGNKPGSAGPVTPTRGTRKRQPKVRPASKPPGDHSPAPARLSMVVKSWWETASVAEVDAEKAAHERLRSEGILVDPFVADMLADEELLIIERYGSWLEGLANETLRPLSVSQERFVRAAQGQRAPEGQYEQAWVMYVGLLKYSPGVSGTSGQGAEALR
jgi:hypothetical protein